MGDHGVWQSCHFNPMASMVAGNPTVSEWSQIMERGFHVIHMSEDIFTKLNQKPKFLTMFIYIFLISWSDEDV